MGSIVRGKIIRDDIALWDGKTATATRVDATGGTITGLQLNDYVDVLQVFGSGTARTLGTIASATSHIGSAACKLMFSPGTWAITDDITIASNFTVHVAAGAVFDVTAGKTITFSGVVIKEAPTWTSGSGTVTESLSQANLIFLQDALGRYASKEVEGALAEITGTASSQGSSIIGFSDPGSDFAATNVEDALVELRASIEDFFSVANAEGASLVGIEDANSQFTGTDVEAALGELGESSGSWAPTWFGFSSDPAGSVYWSKSGSIITMKFPNSTGTSNSTSFAILDVPSAIRPSTDQYYPIAALKDNASTLTTISSVSITAAGTMAFSADTPGTAASWTGSGPKGFGTTTSAISYSIGTLA